MIIEMGLTPPEALLCQCLVAPRTPLRDKRGIRPFAACCTRAAKMTGSHAISAPLGLRRERGEGGGRERGGETEGGERQRERGRGRERARERGIERGEERPRQSERQR